MISVPRRSVSPGLDRSDTIYDRSHPFQSRSEQFQDLALREALGRKPKMTRAIPVPPRFGWKHDPLTIDDVLALRLSPYGPADTHLNDAPPTDFSGVSQGYEGTPRPRITSFW